MTKGHFKNMRPKSQVYTETCFPLHDSNLLITAREVLPTLLQEQRISFSKQQQSVFVPELFKYIRNAPTLPCPPEYVLYFNPPTIRQSGENLNKYSAVFDKKRKVGQRRH